MIICLKTQPNKIFLVKVDDDVYAGWMDGWMDGYQVTQGLGIGQNTY